jgi:hypothetical protein
MSHRRLTIPLLLAILAASAAVGGSTARASQAGFSSHAATAASIHAGHAAAAACGKGYYKNVSGTCIRSPSSNPAGATAKCRDGTYSYSAHASGTCSHHGGVGRWIHHP